MKHLIALISDTHFGSTIAPSPKRFVRDDGDTYSPSPAQEWLNHNWNAYWNWVEAYKERADTPLITIHSGDLVDGCNHHGNTQAVSSSANDEIRLALQMMERARKLSRDMYFIRGTASHVGEASWREEQVARELKAVKEGERSTWDLLKIRIQGIEIHFAHHGAVGRSLRMRNNPARNAAEQHILNAITLKQSPADLLIRGHAHRKADSGTDLPTRVLQLPAWQLKTGYVNRIAPDEYDIADIGGALLIIEDGEVEVKWKIFQPDAKSVVEIN